MTVGRLKIGENGPERLKQERVAIGEVERIVGEKVDLRGLLKQL